MNDSPKQTPISISLGVIGGSGAYDLIANRTLGKNLDTFTLETPFGKSAPIHHFRAGNLEYLFMSRHGEKDYSITATFVNQYPRWELGDYSSYFRQLGFKWQTLRDFQQRPHPPIFFL